MSVQKYVIGQKKGGYTAIPNHVIEGLKDYALIGLYLYLIHLPEGWEFHKSHLQKQGNIGRDKLDKYLSRLEDHGLITTAQKRGTNGRFSHFVMDVFDGSDFKNIDLQKTEKLSTSPCPEKPLTENRLLVNSTYKRNKYKINNITKKRESSAAQSAASPSLSYCPKSKAKLISNEAQEKARKKNLDIDDLLDGFMAHAKAHSWRRADWKAAFLKWVIDERTISEQKDAANITNSPIPTKCTAIEWGPGHPSWEMLHGKRA
jgi:hypothetical protein